MRSRVCVAFWFVLLLLYGNTTQAADAVMQLGWDPVTTNIKGSPTTVTLYVVYQATDDALTSFSRVALVDAKQTTTTLSAAPGKPLRTIVYHRLQYTPGKKVAWGIVAIDEWGNTSAMSTPWVLPITPPKNPSWRRVAFVLMGIVGYIQW